MIFGSMTMTMTLFFTTICSAIFVVVLNSKFVEVTSFYNERIEVDDEILKGANSFPFDSHLIICNDCDDYESIAKAFSKEPKVDVIKGSFSTVSPGWIHLSPIPVDRTCLIPPPVSPTRKITSYVHDQHLLDFLNNRTGKFVNSDGDKSVLGKAVDAAEASMHIFNKENIANECATVDAVDLLMDKDLFLSEYWLKQRPVIIENYLTSQVSVDSILKKHGDIKVGVKFSDSSDFEGIESVNEHWKTQSHEQIIPENVLSNIESPDICVVRAAHEQLSLNDVFPLLYRANITSGQTMESGTTAYVEYQSLSPYPELLNDLLSNHVHNHATDDNDDGDAKEHHHLPSWIKKLVKGCETHMWLGDGTTVGKLHFDRPDNILVQITGSKTFHLIAPGNSKTLREGHMREAMLGVHKKFGALRTNRQIYRKSLEQSTSMVHSPITIEEAKKKEIPTMKCTVKEGQALFVPSFWFHEVASKPSDRQYKFGNLELPLNLAINYWFHPMYDKDFPCVECLKKMNHEYLESEDIKRVLIRNFSKKE